MSELVDQLREQEAAWAERPLVRMLYREWYRAVADRLAGVSGPTVELGSGIGKLREVLGDRVLLTDVEATQWADCQVDALALPFADASLANLVMIDVFHHLAEPSGFLEEANRTLTPGGRVIMIEPYCSPISTPLYRRFHQERTDLEADPFVPDPRVARGAFESNQALPTLVFYRERAEFQRRWPTLRLVEERRFASLAYPLSGGFTRSPLLPHSLYTALRFVEKLFAPIAPLMAFRCLVVLEKTNARQTRMGLIFNL